jgi:hypothetical protein
MRKRFACGAQRLRRRPRTTRSRRRLRSKGSLERSLLTLRSLVNARAEIRYLEMEFTTREMPMKHLLLPLLLALVTTTSACYLATFYRDSNVVKGVEHEESFDLHQFCANAAGRTTDQNRHTGRSRLI